MLVGTPVQVEAAYAEVYEVICFFVGGRSRDGAVPVASAAELALPEGHVKTVWLVPTSLVGQLIGRQGSTVDGLRVKSGCGIKLVDVKEVSATVL